MPYRGSEPPNSKPLGPASTSRFSDDSRSVTVGEPFAEPSGDGSANGSPSIGTGGGIARLGDSAVPVPGGSSTSSKSAGPNRGGKRSSFGSRGQTASHSGQVSFDPAEHQPVGLQRRAGGRVQVVRRPRPQFLGAVGEVVEHRGRLPRPVPDQQPGRDEVEVLGGLRQLPPAPARGRGPPRPACTGTPGRSPAPGPAPAGSAASQPGLGPPGHQPPGPVLPLQHAGGRPVQQQLHPDAVRPQLDPADGQPARPPHAGLGLSTSTNSRMTNRRTASSTSRRACRWVRASRHSSVRAACRSAARSLANSRGTVPGVEPQVQQPADRLPVRPDRHRLERRRPVRPVQPPVLPHLPEQERDRVRQQLERADHQQPRHRPGQERGQRRPTSGDP